MMKHRISAFLLAVLLAVTAAGCSAQGAGGFRRTAGEQCRNRRAFPKPSIPPKPGTPTMTARRSRAGRAGTLTGTFTFQNRNTLTTLSRENQVLETITLPEEALPGSEYSLDRSDDYILALSNPASMNEPYGVVYYTDSGTVCLGQPHSL